MRRLDELGLVDRGPDEWCFAWRVILTRKGERLLHAVRPVLTEVARAEVARAEVARAEVAPVEA
jgi:DNA-binding MarR family transcriptional regulator